MAVLRDVAALGLRNLQEVASDSGEADCLCGRGAFVGSRHFLEVVVIHAKQKGAGDENRNQGTHKVIVCPAPKAGKSTARGVPNTQCRVCATPSGFLIDSLSPLQ